LAGFVSKWTLAWGALAVEADWVVGVLLGSTVLNAAYFLPILYRAWFLEPAVPFAPPARRSRLEIGAALLAPPLFTAACVVLFGVLAGTPFSPLQWARMIALREYGP